VSLQKTLKSHRSNSLAPAARAARAHTTCTHIQYIVQILDMWKPLMIEMFPLLKE